MKALPNILAYILFLGLSSGSLEAQHMRKIGFWGSWNIPCGIAMYSKHVADSLVKLGHEVVHYDYRMPPNALLSRTRTDKIEVLNVQYEEGIMPEKNTFLRVIQEMKDVGIKVVITMHAEPAYAQTLVDAVDATLYHKQPKHLKEYSRVHILPMGVPVFTPTCSKAALRRKYGFSNQDKILISTGFMLPTKEIASILEHLASRIKEDPFIKIQLIHPFTPRNPSACAMAYRHVMNVIKRYNLHDQVILLTDFIPQQELSERIFISDVGYQWFSMDTNATSASTKEYISTRTPLVIPDLSHYHDVHYQGIKVTRRNKTIFTQMLMRLLYQPRRLILMQHHLYRLYQQLNYDNIIKGYHEILQAV